MRIYTYRLALVSSLALFAVVFAMPKQASAHERFDLSIGLGGPTYIAPAPVVAVPAPVVERRWVPGHYEIRATTVLVEPEQYAREWIPPVTRVHVDSFGYRYTVTTPGYYRQIVTPAHYENRETKVWVEGYYQDVAVAPPPVVYRRPAFSFGGLFRF